MRKMKRLIFKLTFIVLTSISVINFVDTVKIDNTEFIDSGVYLRFHISTDASEVAS